jgi:hypothetical protein
VVRSVRGSFGGSGGLRPGWLFQPELSAPLAVRRLVYGWPATHLPLSTARLAFWGRGFYCSETIHPYPHWLKGQASYTRMHASIVSGIERLAPCASVGRKIQRVCVDLVVRT